MLKTEIGINKIILKNVLKMNYARLRSKEREEEEKLLAEVNAKTLSNYFSTFSAFWEQSNVKDYFISSPDLTKEDQKLEKLTAKGFTGLVYQKWKYNVHYGSKEQFIGRFASEIGSKFQELKRTENLYHKLFPNIKLKIEKLITLKSSDKTTGSTLKDRFQDKSVDRTVNKDNKKLTSEVVRSKEKPYRSIDMVGGEYGVQEKEWAKDAKERRGNWTSAEVEVQTGLRKRSKDDPDRWEWQPNLDKGEDKLTERDKDRDKGTQRDSTTRVSTKEEQPSFLTQMSKIIDQCMALETPIAEYVDSFGHFFYINAMCRGIIEWNSATASTELKPAKPVPITEEIEETAEEKKIKKQKDQFATLTPDEYQSLKEKAEAVEDTLILENLARRTNVVKKAGGKAKENRLKGMTGLCLAFSEEVIWSDLENYDKVMKGITGFAEFKEELRKKTKTAYYYRSIGKKIPQTFYCLCGKAGVGKTEISKTLAKAYKRPIVMIGMAGQNHPKILKGMRPTLDSATYGRVAGALCDATTAVFRTKTEWETKLKHLESKKKKTNYQNERIEYIKEEIKAIKDQEKDKERLTKTLNSINQYGSKKEKIIYLNLQERINRLSGKFYAFPSQAPIILLDEFEKVKEETVMFVVGQMTDREINSNYYDDFLEFDVDLSQAIIMLTANYWDRVPDFVRSRCKKVNIQLLTFDQRLEILRNRRDAFVREYFPSDIVGKETVNGVEIKYDEDEYNKSHEPDTFTTEQEQVRKKISEKFLARCITEEFGIRGGIMNLVDAINFLVELKIEGLLDYLPTLDDGEKDENRKEGNHPYKIERNVREDGEGSITLHYQITDKNSKVSE
ncbi:Lon protease [endosymbiont GvMRE of Glomus versiforme]|nr:Lon protease [endosymbiont GvMRE of Glomus versiforme]